MEELKRLSKLVTYSLNINSVLYQDKKQGNKEDVLISNIKKGKYKTDADAALDLYQAGPNDVRYKMLKHRLKRKLYNNLYFIDYNKLNTKVSFQKEQECYSMLHHAHVLLRQYELDLVISIAKKIIAIANQYDFTSLLISGLELLTLSYSQQGALKPFLSAKQDLTVALDKRNYEREAVSLFQYVSINLKKSVKSRKELLPELPSILHKLEDLWNSCGTFDAFESYYKAYIWYNELEGSFANIVTLTVQSERWVEEGKVNLLRFEYSYNKFIIVYAHLRAKHLINGLLYAERFLADFNPNTSKWFAYMENYCLLALHSKLYELADSLFQKVFANGAYSKIGNTAKERWVLYQAYFSLVNSNSTTGIANKKNPYFISLPEYSKDKQGFNVAILVLQFVYFLKKGDAEALMYRIESLKKYILTHLKDNFSLRSKLFLKLLMLTVTEDFNAEVCATKGEKYFEKLKDTPTPGDAYAEIEIIPYEHLWELILDTLIKREA
ncbi:hypothetical protein ACFSKU_03985 [Pontibacter silvestris]|uniref:Uncharacterized protein n=1 Tax=Pontibacter silvestris TaxID=2305183 RepID=A0ABW4WWA7_9BACT|nr:hypothetical protein [Pontibacter silvestris]MCC9137976.1 hypothetical protein [Pontibacter silvestris]